MSIAETLSILAILKAAYPAFYKDMTRKDADAVVDLWASMFVDEPLEIVAAAVKALIVTDEKGYPPHIGAVKAKIRTITEPQELTEGEAWALVSKAVRRTDWNNPKKEFDKLPEIVQKAIGSANMLLEWGMVDEQTFGTVIASNFQRTYRAKAAAEKEYRALPSDVRMIAEQMAKKLSLTGGGENDGNRPIELRDVQTQEA